MDHPTEQQLHAWLDGDDPASPRFAEVGSHVERCARCRQLVAGAESVGVAVRSWARDWAPAATGELVDDIMRAVEAEAAASPRALGAPSAPYAAMVARSAGALAHVSSLDQARSARGRRSRVIAPLGLLAVAAAVVLLVRIGGVSLTSGSDGPQVQHHGDSGVLARSGPPKLAPVPRGTEVLNVHPADDQPTTYAVMEVPGEIEGITTSVVWIDDHASDDESPAVPSSTP